MKIVDFVKGLLPALEKNQVLEDLRVTMAELENILQPNFKTASDFFKSSKHSSNQVKYISETFYKNLDSGGIAKQPNFIGEVAVRTKNLQDNARYIYEQIEKIMERDIIHDGLTAKKALLIRAASGMSFISNFSIDLLNYVYVFESINANAEVEDSIKLSPAEIKKVEARIHLFARMISDYGMDNKKFTKIITEVPEVIVNSKTSMSVASLYPERSVDPLSASYISGFKANPIYHIRLSIAEWQASRYKVNKDKKKMLELRLLHLKLLNEKKNSAKVEAEIEYIQARIAKIERYLRDVEESLPDED